MIAALRASSVWRPVTTTSGAHCTVLRTAAREAKQRQDHRFQPSTADKEAWEGVLAAFQAPSPAELLVHSTIRQRCCRASRCLYVTAAEGETPHVSRPVRLYVLEQLAGLQGGKRQLRLGRTGQVRHRSSASVRQLWTVAVSELLARCETLFDIKPPRRPGGRAGGFSFPLFLVGCWSTSPGALPFAFVVDYTGVAS